MIMTAYGVPALIELRVAVAAVKDGDPLAPVTILVPSQVAGIVVRRDLAVSRSGVAGLTVTTLPRLSEQLATRGPLPRPPVTRAVLATAWRAALDADPGLFADVAAHPAAIRALVRVHRELRNLGRDGLEAVAGSGRLGADVVRLHQHVTGRLLEGWCDETDLLVSATERLRGQPSVADPLGCVVLYLPQDISNAESVLAAELHALGLLTVIAGMTGDDAAVYRSLTRIGISPPSPRPNSRPAGAHQVLHASDADDEVRCVVRWVMTLLQVTPAHRVAVLYSSNISCARLPHEHLGAAGLAVNCPGTQSVRERPIARGLLALHSLAAAEVPQADLLAALSQAPVHQWSGGSVPTSRWELASQEPGVVRGRTGTHDSTGCRSSNRWQRTVNRPGLSVVRAGWRPSAEREKQARNCRPLPLSYVRGWPPRRDG